MSYLEQRERKEIEEIEEMYRQAVMLSYKLGAAYSERIQRLPESMSPDPLTYPPCHYQSFYLGEDVVHQLSYQGMLPLYSKEKKYENNIRDYYAQATVEAIAELNIQAMESAFIYIAHFFENLLVRDLDNRNRRHLINAIRYAGFIKDDSWRIIQIMECGLLDTGRKNHVQVFITSSENFSKLVENVQLKYNSDHDFSGVFEPDNTPYEV